MSQVTRRTRFFGIDNDTKEYVNAILDNGGSISLGAVQKIDHFVKGLKSDGLWDLILDMGIFVGVDNLNAALVKLKTSPGVPRVLVNNNIVEGDYKSSGSLAGITDGSGKFLNTRFSKTPSSGASLSMYLQTNDSTVNGRLMGVINNPANSNFRFLCGGSSSVAFVGGDTATGATSSGVGFYIGTTFANSQQIYKNGIVEDVTSFNYLPIAAEVHILGVNGLVGETTNTQSFYSIGRLMSAPQASQFSNRVNSLMAQFGANVY